MVFVAGDYRVEIWTQPEVQIVYLKDGAGKVVASLRDCRAGLLGLHYREREFFGDLTRDGVREIVFETWSGGAHGSNTFHIWSVGTRPRCLLSYDKGNVSDEDDFEFRDLDGDGKQEIVSWYDGFSYSIFGAYTATLPLVFRFESGRYRESTRRFPQVIEPYLQRYRTELAEPDPRFREEAAVGLYALAVIRNTRASTLAYLGKQLPAPEYQALLKDRSRIERIVKGVAERITYPRAYSKSARLAVD